MFLTFCLVVHSNMISIDIHTVLSNFLNNLGDVSKRDAYKVLRICSDLLILFAHGLQIFLAPQY